MADLNAAYTAARQAGYTDAEIAAYVAQNPSVGSPADWHAYLAAYPDVAAEANRPGVADAVGDVNGDGTYTPEDFAAYHYAHSGLSEGRQLPTVGPAGPAGPPPVPSTSMGVPNPSNRNVPENVDWGAYVNNQPDVKAYWDQIQISNPGMYTSPEQFGQAHYLMAQDQGAVRDVKPFTSTYVQPTTTSDTLGPDISPRPAALPRETYTRPAEVARPDMGAAPTYVAPAYQDNALGAPPTMARPDVGKLDVSLDAYTPSPDYQWQLDQAKRATIAGASATHALESGGAAKALQDRAQNIALGDYNQWRNFTAGRFDTNAARSDTNFAFDKNAADRQWEFGSTYKQNAASAANAFNLNNAQFGASFGDNQYRLKQSIFADDRARRDLIFADDRARGDAIYDTDVNRNNALYNFDSGRIVDGYNNRINALSGVSGQGVSGASALSGAGANFVNSTSANNNSAAQAAGGAALNTGAAINSTLSNAGNALAYYYGSRGQAPS